MSPELLQELKKRYTYDGTVLYNRVMDKDITSKFVMVKSTKLSTAKVCWYLYYNEWPTRVLLRIDTDVTNNAIENFVVKTWSTVMVQRGKQPLLPSHYSISAV